MRAILTRLFGVTAAALAAVALYVLFTTPPAALELDGAVPDHVALGAYHVHSSRSDGIGSVARIASAAASAGLAFVILTDHGDATRAPDPPAYVDGVLLIDAVEVGTDSGHLVALGLREPSPYPLAGHPREVVEDVHRLGGMAIVAHPDSPNPELRWRGMRVGFDGIEWLNADSEWRDEGPWTLGATALRALVRPAESVASLFSRPERSLQRWDQALRTRPVVGLAAADAHGGVTGERDEGDGRAAILRVPGYRAMFRAMAQAVTLARPLSGDAADDAARVLDALRAGRTWSIVRALAGPAHLEFVAVDAAGIETTMGARVPDLGGRRVEFRARVPQAPGSRITLHHRGQVVATGQGSLTYSAPAPPGAYRVEVSLPGSEVPWIVSSPIYLGRTPAGEDGPVPAGAAAEAGDVVPLPADNRWVVEADASSDGTVTVDDGLVAFTYRLGGGPPSGQYAALVAPVGDGTGYDRLRFTISAETPMRVSVQMRLPGGRDGLRWRRSVYVDRQPRIVVVQLEDLEPVGGASSQQPLVAPIQSLLFVVDTVNTLPGASGTIRVSGIGLGVGDLGDAGR